MIAGQEVIFEPPAFEKCIYLGINIIIIIIIIIFILRIIIIFLWHMRNEHLLCTRANFSSLGILLLLI